MIEPHWLSHEERNALELADTDDPCVVKELKADKFYFLDETWSELYGPFPNYWECESALHRYATWLSGDQ